MWKSFCFCIWIQILDRHIPNKDDWNNHNIYKYTNLRITKRSFSFVLKVESLYISKKDAFHTPVVRNGYWCKNGILRYLISGLEIFYFIYSSGKCVLQALYVPRYVYICIFLLLKKPYMTSVGVEDRTSQGPSRKLMIPQHSMDYACSFVSNYQVLV